MDAGAALITLRGGAASVPMARGKHLFPCRTQKLSLAAVTILGGYPWEDSTVPNYRKPLRIGEVFFCVYRILGRAKVFLFLVSPSKRWIFI